MSDSEFLSWWFTEHWFWSTVLTPWLCFAWACWKGLFWRGVMAFLLAGSWGGALRSRRR